MPFHQKRPTKRQKILHIWKAQVYIYIVFFSMFHEQIIYMLPGFLDQLSTNLSLGCIILSKKNYYHLPWRDTGTPQASSLAHWLQLGFCDAFIIFLGLLRGSLIFPKVPQSSQTESSGFPRNTPPLEHPPLKNNINHPSTFNCIDQKKLARGTTQVIFDQATQWDLTLTSKNSWGIPGIPHLVFL